jgi:hypothetical protein
MTTTPNAPMSCPFCGTDLATQSALLEEARKVIKAATEKSVSYGPWEHRIPNSQFKKLEALLAKLPNPTNEPKPEGTKP